MLRSAAVILALAVCAPMVLGEATPPAPGAAPHGSSYKRAANETAIYVSDMHCAGCAKKIAGRLFRVKGVVGVRTDFKIDLAIVTPQAKKTLDAKALWAAVQAAGKHPVKLIGPEGTFVADKKTGAPVKTIEPTTTAAR